MHVSGSREGACHCKTRENKQKSFPSHAWWLSQHTVVESEADDCFLVATVLPLDLSCLHTPKPGQVIRGGWNRKWKEEWDISHHPLNLFFVIIRKAFLLLHSKSLLGLLMTGKGAKQSKQLSTFLYYTTF